MRKILTNPFTDYLPKLDVHGQDKSSVCIVVNEFINDNLKLKNEKIIIIHGLGKGLLKKEIHVFLSKHKNISKFYIDVDNLGQTIVELSWQNP